MDCGALMDSSANKLPGADLADLNGSVKFSFARGVYRIRFGYAEITKMQAMWGEDFMDKLDEATSKMRVAQLCAILSIGTGIDRTQIMEDSPPILPAIAAVGIAWRSAWNGGPLALPEVNADDEEDDQDTEDMEEVKKPEARPTLFQRLGCFVFGPGFLSKSSTP